MIEEAFASIENMEKFCNKILDSKLAPDHFYPKLPGSNDRDYTKGNTAAVMMVLIQGNQLHLPVLTSLQQIVPVNGLLSIKGDGAKGMILGSGKVEPGSWNEVETGSLESGNYSVTISAERSDTHEKLSRTFSVERAKRAGLWVTEAMVNSQEGWKWKKSAWYKFPDRMVKYRALGFLARDLFPDVMAGTYITEEARDIPTDTTEIIETDEGNKIILPDKQHAKTRARKMTERVVDKIPDNKFEPVVKETIPDAVIVEPEKHQEEAPFTGDKGSVEYLDGKIIRKDGKPVEDDSQKQNESQEKKLEDMDSKELLAIINDDMDMMEASKLIPGKNTAKKLREIIVAFREGKLAEHVAPFLAQETGQNEGVSQEPGEDKNPDIKPNKEFDKQKSDKENDDFLNKPIKTPEKKESAGNKYNLKVPEYDKGSQRDFATTKSLYNLMMGVMPQITSPRYLVLGEKLGFLTAYKDKETFCRDATVEEINQLLNEN